MNPGNPRFGSLDLRRHLYLAERQTLTCHRRAATWQKKLGMNLIEHGSAQQPCTSTFQTEHFRNKPIRFRSSLTQSVLQDTKVRCNRLKREIFFSISRLLTGCEMDTQMSCSTGTEWSATRRHRTLLPLPDTLTLLLSCIAALTNNPKHINHSQMVYPHCIGASLVSRFGTAKYTLRDWSIEAKTYSSSWGIAYHMAYWLEATSLCRILLLPYASTLSQASFAVDCTSVFWQYK